MSALRTPLSDFKARRRSKRLTPLRAPLASHKSISDVPECPHNPERFKSIVRKIGHIYQVSPLWKWESSEQALKAYSEELTGLLASLSPSLKKKGESRKTGRKAGSYIAKLSAMKDFASEGSYCVKVTVRLEGSLAGSSPECVVLMCKLLETPAVEKGFTYLPLMVASGHASVSQVVIDWVRSCFDCCVRVANLEQPSLLAIASKYATAQLTNGHSGKHVEGLTLTYELPEAVRKAGLSSIVLDFPSDSIAILAHDNSLCHTLQQTIYNHFHLKFSSLNLVAVSMPVFKMNCHGTVKFLSIQHVFPILCVIQQALLPWT